jgi:hypothetical protein
MRQNYFRNLRIECDHLTLGETVSRKVDLFNVRDREIVAIDLDLVLARHLV